MSNNSSLYLKGFTSQLNDFINDLIIVYHDRSNLITYKKNIELLMKNNPRLLIINWKKYISKYNDQIENEDLLFFLNKDYKEDVKMNEYLIFIDELKNIMKEMNSENKEKTIKYIKNLNKLASLYN